MTIWDEIKMSFKQGSILTKLIYINLGVFVGIYFIYVFYFLFTSDASIYYNRHIVSNLVLPSNINVLASKPWTLITYMFLHLQLFHIFFNMFALFVFGRIFLHFMNGKQMLSIYILGGLFGAFLFILTYNLIPDLANKKDVTVLLGASAGVMAIAMTVAFYAPNYTVNLMFIGPVRLKYIALALIILDIVQIPLNNSGGHISHLGGVIFAYFYAIQYKKGKDIGSGINHILDSIATLFKPHKRKMKVTYHSEAKNIDDLEYNHQKKINQEEIDRILDKIAKSGYDNLSKKEKETLFKMSDKNKS